MIVEWLAWGIAIGLAGMMALVIRGFLPVALHNNGSAVYHLSVGVILILIASAARALYWDALPMLLDAIQPGLWALWHQHIGRPLPNIAMGLIFGAGLLHMLKLSLLLIPEPDRSRYSMWSAPFYPQRVCIIRGVDALRRVWRKDR